MHLPSVSVFGMRHPVRQFKLTTLLLLACCIALASNASRLGAQAQPAPGAADAKPAKPAPDVLVFTNGDQLSGLLVRATGNSIVFKSDMAGEITVTADKVKELHSSGSFAVLLKNVKLTRSTVASVQTGTVSLEDGNLTLANPSAEAQTIPYKSVDYLIDQVTYDQDIAKKPKVFTGWNGSVTGGASLVRSTQNSETFTGGIALVRAIPTVPWLPKANRTSFDANEAYGKVTQAGTPNVKTNIFHADAERDEYFSPRAFALAQLAFDHNYSQGLDLAQTYGVGIGVTVIQRPVEELDLKVDVHYLKQQFQISSSNQNLIGSTFAETYLRNLPHKIVFNQMLALVPAWNNFSAYAANASAGLILPVYKRLSLSVGSIDNFLNDPPPGFQKNSFQFTTGVTYTLR